jgi:hypothetical protein
MRWSKTLAENVRRAGARYLSVHIQQIAESPDLIEAGEIFLNDAAQQAFLLTARLSLRSE